MEILSLGLANKINAVRDRKGEDVLVWNEELSVAALGRASEMFAALKKSLPKLKSSIPFGENTFHSGDGTEEVAKAGDIARHWMRFNCTRSNILHPGAKYVGIAAVGNEADIFVSCFVTNELPSEGDFKNIDAESCEEFVTDISKIPAPVARSSENDITTSSKDIPKSVARSQHPDLVTCITDFPKEAAKSPTENKRRTRGHKCDEDMITEITELPQRQQREFVDTSSPEPEKKGRERAQRESKARSPERRRKEQADDKRTARSPERKETVAGKTNEKADEKKGSPAATPQLELLDSDERKEIYKAVFGPINTCREENNTNGHKWDDGLYCVAREHAKKMFLAGKKSPLDKSKITATVAHVDVREMSTRAAAKEICRKLHKDGHGSSSYKYGAIGLYGTRKHLYVAKLVSHERAKCT